MKVREKKMLIVGGAYADIPQINAARALGYYVITSGNRPDDWGHRESDLYCAADYSDPDEILAIAKEHRVDAVCPSANDFSAISAAYVAETMGLPGHDSFETSKVIHHKDSYRRLADELGISTPKAMGFSRSDDALEMADEFRFPVLVKPIDLTGGKGISKVEVPQSLKPALETAFIASKSKRVVVEEFIEGTRHGFSSFIKNGRVRFYFVDDEFYFKNPFLVSGASTTTRVPSKAIEQVIQDVESIARSLSLQDGIVHVQFILARETPTIIEICRRPPGDLYVKLVQFATGVDYPGWIVRQFAGVECPDLSHRPTQGHWLRHCIMADSAGIVTAVDIDPEVQPHIYRDYSWWSPGTRVNDWMSEKLGIVFLRFDSEQKLLELGTDMQRLISPRLDSVSTP